MILMIGCVNRCRPSTCMRLLASAVVVTGLLGVSGCASVVPTMTNVLPSVESPRVVDIVALWQPGEGRDKNGIPTRGFAGQVFFFAAGSQKPVEVDGDVSVFVFDDQGDLADRQKPVHEFHFRGGIFAEFKTDSNLGPAYQLFVPYTRFGEHRAACSLRVQYTVPNGVNILSESAEVVLAGTTPEELELASEFGTTIERATKPSGLVTTQIDLPSPTNPRSVTSLKQFVADAANTERYSGVQRQDSGVQHAVVRSESDDAASSTRSVEQTSYRFKPADRKYQTYVPFHSRHRNDDRVSTIPLDD